MDKQVSTERDQIILDVFTTALDSLYWGQRLVYKWSTDGGTTPDLRGFHATILDEDGEKHEVVRSTITHGLRLAYADRGKFSPYIKKALADLTFGNFDEVDFDADVADIILQYGLLGEAIYG